MLRLKRLTVSPGMLVALLVVAYLVATVRSQEEIARVRVAAERVTAEKDSVERVLAVKSAAQVQLQRQRDDRENEAARLRESVAALEQDRAEQQLRVRQLRKTSELQRKLEQTFPELAASAWGLTSVPVDDSDTLGIEYLMVPAWFTETFVIDHQNAAAWERQRDDLTTLDSLELQVALLQDSVMQLQLQKTAALRAGYNDTFRSYQGLSDRYIAELKKPRLSLGGTLGLCIGAAGAGVIVGTLVNR